MPFQKGKSGNPSGRPSVIVDGVNIAELARERGQKAIETLTAIMLNEELPTAARVKAAESLLDRGFGKPLQKAELTGAEGKDLMPTNTAEAARELVTTLAELERLGVIKLPE